MKLSALLFALFFVVSQGFSQPKSLHLQASANGRYLQWSADKLFFINDKFEEKSTL